MGKPRTRSNTKKEREKRELAEAAAKEAKRQRQSYAAPTSTYQAFYSPSSSKDFSIHSGMGTQQYTPSRLGIWSEKTPNFVNTVTTGAESTPTYFPELQQSKVIDHGTSAFKTANRNKAVQVNEILQRVLGSSDRKAASSLYQTPDAMKNISISGEGGSNKTDQKAESYELNLSWATRTQEDQSYYMLEETITAPTQQTVNAPGQEKLSTDYYQTSGNLCDEEGCNANNDVESDAPALSANLTEMIKMWDDSFSDDEVESRPDPALVTVNGYRMKEMYASTLRDVISKHGDIARNCVLKTIESRSTVLEMVCDTIQNLKEKKLGDLLLGHIEDQCSVVRDLEEVALDVGWLRERLENIAKAKQMIKRCGVLRVNKKEYENVIETTKNEIKEYEEKMCLLKEKLGLAENEANKIKREARIIKAMVLPFQDSLVEGLL